MADARLFTAALKPEAVADADLLRRRAPRGNSRAQSLLTSEKLVVNNSAFRQEFLLGSDSPEIRAATLASSPTSSASLSTARCAPASSSATSSSAARATRSTRTSPTSSSSRANTRPTSSRRAPTSSSTRSPTCSRACRTTPGRLSSAACATSSRKRTRPSPTGPARLFDLAYDHDADWGRRAATLGALDQLTKERTREILAHALDPATREMRTFLGFARQHGPAAPPATTFTDRGAWKKTQKFE